MLGAHLEAEIREQPDVWRRIATSDAAQRFAATVAGCDIVFLGSGSSLFVAMLAALAWRRRGVRARALAATEARFDHVMSSDACVVALSQSGRSTDLLGALDLIALGPAPLEMTAFAKGLAQWVTIAAPLALLAPVIVTALGAPMRLAPIIVTGGLVGGLSFCFLGGVGAALSLGSRRGGVLIALIVLPLFTPPVIFGAGAIEAFGAGLDWRTPLLLLSAYSLAATALCPFAMAAAARNAIS